MVTLQRPLLDRKTSGFFGATFERGDESGLYFGLFRSPFQGACVVFDEVSSL